MKDAMAGALAIDDAYRLLMRPTPLGSDAEEPSDHSRGLIAQARSRSTRLRWSRML